ncbi:PucR family transcriptional regulator [Thermomonospora umbrina]|uniref:PucR-like helix-turn-helix protein n=1 Tax=Thermomonospora umbrina TaxID=111806 RepID=A0A3D9SSS7_9ACTN|nr:helix-turn-helix domain-containing protein [Thermomonospora umbrina]REE97053.1 PucR-like helix-turn-helix protein [Thermomonospora umbrina]
MAPVTSDATRPPWSLVPAETAALLRRHQQELAIEIIGEVEAQVPEFGRLDAVDRRAAMVEAVRGGVAEFAGLLGAPAARRPQHLIDRFAAAGAEEARAGRALDRFQAALRAGARAVLRWLSVQSERLRLPRSAYRAFAEAVFAALDEFAAAAAEGHRRELGRQGEDRRRNRARLLSLLTMDPPLTPEALADVAAQADWTLPRTMAAVVFTPREVDANPAFPGLPSDVLVDAPDHRGAAPWGIVPDPDRPGGLPFLAEPPERWIAVVGPTVAAEEGAISLRWARQTLGLLERGIIARPTVRGPISWADHLPSLVLFQNEELHRMMAARRLTPLLKLRPREAERLGGTLLACLQHGFHVKNTAQALQVHPQTVRYRMNQLEALFGDDLHAVDRRLELEMALHAWLATLAAGSRTVGR